MLFSGAAFPRLGYRKLGARLLEQPRRTVLGGRGGSLSWCRMSVDLLLLLLQAGSTRRRRRGQLCRGAAFAGPLWALPPFCPAPRQSFSVTAKAPLSLCRSIAVKMSTSSSSSTSNGQEKPKPKSPFRKRGSLQSNIGSGELPDGVKASCVTVKNSSTDPDSRSVGTCSCLSSVPLILVELLSFVLETFCAVLRHGFSSRQLMISHRAHLWLDKLVNATDAFVYSLWWMSEVSYRWHVDGTSLFISCWLNVELRLSVQSRRNSWTDDYVKKTKTKRLLKKWTKVCMDW